MTTLPEWFELGPTDEARRLKWRAMAHAALPDGDLSAIRDSLRSGRPYGEPAWAERCARALGLDWSRRPRGRPRKAPDN